MNRSEFHYTTYIRSTPEQVWRAITTPEFALQYWGNATISEWKPGSRWELKPAHGAAIITGVVREAVPPKRLVLSWAAPEDAADPGKHSRVTFAIEQVRDVVRLDVIHDQLEPGSAMAQGISGGWPQVLSSLKTLLETGQALVGIGCSSGAAH